MFSSFVHFYPVTSPLLCKKSTTRLRSYPVALQQKLLGALGVLLGLGRKSVVRLLRHAVDGGANGLIAGSSILASQVALNTRDLSALLPAAFVCMARYIFLLFLFVVT